MLESSLPDSLRAEVLCLYYRTQASSRRPSLSGPTRRTPGPTALFLLLFLPFLINFHLVFSHMRSFSGEIRDLERWVVLAHRESRTKARASWKHRAGNWKHFLPKTVESRSLPSPGGRSGSGSAVSCVAFGTPALASAWHRSTCSICCGPGLAAAEGQAVTGGALALSNPEAAQGSPTSCLRALAFSVSVSDSVM